MYHTSTADIDDSDVLSSSGSVEWVTVVRGTECSQKGTRSGYLGLAAVPDRNSSRLRALRTAH